MANRQRTYLVKNSPWRDKLPNGTEVVPCDPREDFEHSQWYQRVDKKLLFPNEPTETDGKFVLRSDEIEIVKLYLVKVEKLVAIASEDYPAYNAGYDCEASQEVEMTEEEYFRTADEESFRYTIIKEY
jgi:hypothetical protein